jgi:predicted nucleotidyltransferase
MPVALATTCPETRCRRMRASAPGQSALLMADVAESLTRRGVRYAVIGAMAAAVHGVVRASLDADAIVMLQVREAQALRQSLVEEGYEVALRIGDVDDPIPGLLEIRDRHGNRVDLLLGLRGMDPELLDRTRQVRLGEAILAIVGREDFIAMKAFAGGPVDLADARAVIDLDRETLDLELLRRLAQRFGLDAARVVDDLIGAVDE